MLLYLKKVKQWIFSETTVVYNIKVGRCSQLNEYMNLSEYVQGHSDSTFSNFFSLETARWIEANFHVEPPWDWGMTVSKNGLCYMTKMAAMPIYVKNLLWNQKADDLWHWLLQHYQVYSNDVPGLIFIYFTAKLNLVPFVLYGEMLKL